jgi:hypothetical protein
MKATIISHSRLPEGHAEIHRFGFLLDDGAAAMPYSETISLRTARVIVAHLEDGNAFIQMLREIVAAAPASYDLLIGRTFADESPDGVSDRLFNKLQASH